ncbi:hypothetical protein D3C73_977000 [compost metagenome]
MQLQRGGLRVGQRAQPRLDDLHFPVDVVELLLRFTGINIGFNAFYRGGQPVLVQLAIDGNHILLLGFDLRQHGLQRRLRLPFPV